MTHLVELHTAAGVITLGPFTTLEQARTYAGALGVIVPLFAPTVPARELIEGTRAQVFAALDKK